MTDYRTIADRIAGDIAAGKLRPGDRLPPQRAFAHTHALAASTAGRVYAELVRRGLATGEVGRGTFVRAAPPAPSPALTEPSSARIDLEMNSPILPDQHAMLAGALSALIKRPDALNQAMRPVSVAGTHSARHAAAAGLAHRDWQPAPGSVLFAGSGRQALAAVFSALVPAGERIGFEALTYPVAKAIAARLGLVPVPLAMDADGVRPDAVEAAHRAGPLRAVYVQPTLQNPLGSTMPVRRREALAAVLRRLDDPVAVEDAVYAFLDGTAPAPLAALAPEHTVFVDSLSKRVAPGLTLGFIAAPDRLLARIAAALRSGAWSAPGFALDTGVRWMADGTVAALAAAKRADAAARQTIAAERLAGLAVRAHPAAYHLWLELPQGWRAEAFALAAAERGIAITPAAAFTVSPAHAPNAVRLALASPGLDALASALAILADLARREREPPTMD